jgi:hypothetical protein
LKQTTRNQSPGDIEQYDTPMTNLIIHILLVLLMPLLLLGVIGKTKAAFAGRTGAPYLQPREAGSALESGKMNDGGPVENGASLRDNFNTSHCIFR